MESSFGMTEDHAHVYKQRLSVEEVEKAAREKDGLMPGSTVHYGEHDAFPDIFDVPEVVKRIVPDQALIKYYNLPAGESDKISSYLHEYGEFLFDDNGDEIDINESNSFEDYVSKFHRIEEIGYIIADIQSTQSKGDDSAARQKKVAVIRKVIDDFKEINPETELDINQPGSVVGIGEFIEYYKTSIHEQLYSNELEELIEDNRQLLIDGLNSMTIKQQLGAANAKRIARHFEQQPLIIVDPLMSLSDLKYGDYLGWFKPDDRVCYIDPLTIAGTQNINLESALFKAQMLKTMAHEFMHAATSNVYRAYKEESSPIVGLDSKQIWPQFFYEGMVEKAAYMLALNTKPEWFSEPYESMNRRIVRYETNIREHYSDNPDELLATQAVKEARGRAPSSYPEYRLLIDTIMEKADWQAAGISRKQADRLAIKAFFDRSDDRSTLDSSARKSFMQALHGATHPGFLNKIANIVDVYGIDMAMDILESPNFEPHDDNAFPMLAGQQYANRLRSSIQQLHGVQKRIDKLRELNAPLVTIEHEEKLIKRLEGNKNSSEALKMARKGLEGLLHHTYGQRQRKRSAEERLRAVIFGEPSKTTHEPVNISQEELKKHQKAVDDWKVQREANRKTYAAYKRSIREHRL